MTTLIADAQPSGWQLGAATPGTNFVPITQNGAQVMLQLVTRDAMPSVRMPFEPGVYQGTGQETRKNAVFTVPASVVSKVTEIEAWAESAIKALGTTAVWNTALRADTGPTRTPGDPYTRLRTKITVSGEHGCQFVDTDGKPRAAPDDWRRACYVPIVQVSGIYIQGGGTGLVLNVAALMIGPLVGGMPIVFT